MGEGLIANFLPAAARLSGILTAQRMPGGGQEAENDGRFFVGETGFDNKSTELDLAPGIEPALSINDPLHLNSSPP